MKTMPSLIAGAAIIASGLLAVPVSADSKIKAPNLPAQSLSKPHGGGSTQPGVTPGRGANIPSAALDLQRILGGHADAIREQQNLRELQNFRELEEMMNDLRDGSIDAGALPDLFGGGDAGGQAGLDFPEQGTDMPDTDAGRGRGGAWKVLKFLTLRALGIWKM